LAGGAGEGLAGLEVGLLLNHVVARGEATVSTKAALEAWLEGRVFLVLEPDRKLSPAVLLSETPLRPVRLVKGGETRAHDTRS
jgi:hypothetical protein